MSNTRAFTISDELHRYIVGHGSPPDEIAADLAAETRERFPDWSAMQIGPEQGAFMALLASLLRPSFCVEVGTFTGYSSLCVARALPADGRMLCCDVNEEWTDIARRYWARAGIEERIELRIGPAIDTLRSLPAERSVDFAFVDADKEGYIDYYEALLPRLSERGVLLVDNVLWGGTVLETQSQEESTLAIQAFNEHVAHDPRSEVVMLPVGDGLSLIRRLD